VPAVVVCHPHPLYGGSMHNNVTLPADALVKSGMAALLFNFRGVVGAGEVMEAGPRSRMMSGRD
jgi:alpha/beta superfamily hydrolase